MSEKRYWNDKLFLIVEDDPASSLLLEVILAKTGAKMLFAECGEKAVEIVRRTRGIDLILMDIKMSGINGLQTTLLIRQICPNVPIIAQTACVIQGDKDRCLQAGCTAYISKPIVAEVLLDQIERILNISPSRNIFQNPIFSN